MSIEGSKFQQWIKRRVCHVFGIWSIGWSDVIANDVSWTIDLWKVESWTPLFGWFDIMLIVQLQ